MANVIMKTTAVGVAIQAMLASCGDISSVSSPSLSTEIGGIQSQCDKSGAVTGSTGQCLDDHEQNIIEQYLEDEE